MFIIKKIILIIIICLLCFCFFSCSSNSVKDSNYIPGMQNPWLTSIHDIQEIVKETFYPTFSIRIFNPLYSMPNMNLDSKNFNDGCKKISINANTTYILDGKNANSLPTFLRTGIGMENAYYDAVYSNIVNTNSLHSLFPSSNVFSYELKGFAYFISIKKDNEIIASSMNNSGLSPVILDNSSEALGRFNPDMPDFIEDTTMTGFTPNNYDEAYKYSKYQAMNSYDNVSYKTCSIILFDSINTNIIQGFWITNLIKISEFSNGYEFNYYLRDLSYFKTNISIDDYNNLTSLNSITTPLKTKTIYMAESYISHSLDYLSMQSTN